MGMPRIVSGYVVVASQKITNLKVKGTGLKGSLCTGTFIESEDSGERVERHVLAFIVDVYAHCKNKEGCQGNLEDDGVLQPRQLDERQSGESIPNC